MVSYAATLECVIKFKSNTKYANYVQSSWTIFQTKAKVTEKF